MPIPSIFLSYARNDDSFFVKKLYHDLKLLGFDIWWDMTSMPSRDLTFLQEIRDAINGVDRLLLVIGPHAVESDYVRAEWAYAREICTPVNPILRAGDFDLLPNELRNLDTRDFRDDANYTDQLERLVQQLHEDIPPLGRLINVPALPPHYLPRLEHLSEIGEHALSDINAPTVITAERKTTAVQGMSGIGKTSIAVAFARACTTRRAFSDGIVWVTVGKRAELRALYELAGVGLGDMSQNYREEIAGKANLQKMLAGKTCLIVLDDVWQMEHAAPFRDLVADGRSRLLITTRDNGIAVGLGAQEHMLNLLSDEQSLTLLAEWAEMPVGALPDEAPDVIRECGNLPLALAMIGATVRDKPDRWRHVLHRLCTADVGKIRQRFPNYPYESVLSAIQVSVDELEPEHRARYLDFAVFREDTHIPEAAVITLWEPLGLDEFDAVEVLDDLVARSLVQREGDGRLVIHDLLVDYVRNPDVRRDAGAELGLALHERLLDVYRTKCSDGWHTGPNDGYFFENLAYHLHEAGHNDELYILLTESAPDGGPNPWVEAKFAACVGDTNYAADLALAISDFADPLAPHQMLVVMQLHTARQVVYERVSVYDDLALKTLVLLEREKEALSHARLRSEPFDRSSGLLTIFQILAEQGQRHLGLLRESLLAATKVQNEQRRVAALDKVATALENAHDTDIEAIIDELETVTRSIGDKEGRGSILQKLALLCDSLGERERALQIAQTIQDEMFHAIALCGLKYSIAVAEGKGFDELFTDVFLIAHSIQSPYHRVHVLSILGTVFSSVRNEYAVELFAEAEKATNSIQDESFRMNALNILATALGNAGWYDKANAVTSGIRDRYIRARALQSISNSLVEAGQYNQAREVARSIQDEWVCVQALINLAVALIKSGDVHISDELFTEAEVIISKIPFEGQKAEALRHFAGALAEAGRYAHAEQVAYAIQDKERKIGALRELTLSLAKRGDGRAIELFSETTETARSIQHGLQGLYQANAIRDLASLLVKTRDARAEGLFSKAIEIARGIEKGVYRADALRNLAKALAEAANEHTDEIFVEVTEVACNIPNEGARAQSLRYLAGILAEERRFDEAEATARIIQNPVNRVIALSGLGLWLAKVEDARADAILSEAENLARGISDEWARAEALSGLAVALTILGDNRGDELFTEALSLIHNLQDVIHRVTALNNLANAMAAAGSERAFEVFHKAEEVARENHQELLRDEALVGWVTITAYSGQHDRASEMLHGIQSEAHQAIALHHLATALAQAGKFSQALSVLGSCELDKYVEVLCSWGSTLETHAPDVVITILTNILRMAGWVRSDWRKVHLLLTADDRRGVA